MYTVAFHISYIHITWGNLRKLIVIIKLNDLVYFYYCPFDANR